MWQGSGNGLFLTTVSHLLFSFALDRFTVSWSGKGNGEDGKSDGRDGKEKSDDEDGKKCDDKGDMDDDSLIDRVIVI
jgi:hypothetical protein